LVVSIRGLILRHYLDIYLERLRKTTKTLITIAGRRGLESYPVPSEYEVGVYPLDHDVRLIGLLVSAVQRRSLTPST
jgi:hypothetical protein